MLKHLFRTALTLVILAWLLPTVNITSITTLVLATIALVVLFSLVKPILSLLFLPINFVTLGLFSGLLNVALLWLATYLVPGFIIEPMAVFGINLTQFWTLVVVSFMIGFINSIIKVAIK